MTPQQQINALLELLSGLYNDAQMAIDRDWDKSDSGFEAQQLDIEKTMKRLGLMDTFNAIRDTHPIN